MDQLESYRRGTTLLEAGALDQAETVLTELVGSLGPNFEAVLRTAQVMLRWGDADVLKSQLNAAAAAHPGQVFAPAMLALVDVLQRKYPKVMLDDVADRLERVSLFEDASDHLLHINLDLPITTCNYRCSYCFLKHDIKPDLDKLKDLDRLIDRLALIRRPLGITFVPQGEVSAVPAVWPFYDKIGRLPNLAWLEIWSNLSRDPEPIVRHVPRDKLNFIATYHPTEFKSFERDNEAFFRRVAWLKQEVVDLTLNFVLCDENMPYLEPLQQRVAGLDVFLTYNPQISSANGYGALIKPLSPEHHDRARALMNNPFMEYYFLEARRDDVRCTAGRDRLNILYDGRVRRCEYLSVDTDEREDMGNVLDGSAVIDRVNRFCKRGGCACKGTLGNIEKVVAVYKRVGTQHHYIKRPAGEVGTHSYDPVVLPALAKAALAPARSSEPVE